MRECGLHVWGGGGGKGVCVGGVPKEEEQVNSCKFSVLEMMQGLIVSTCWLLYIIKSI